MRKEQIISILVVAMSLGTAWAVRGHFGHEQGAAWAGGIGALALVLVSRRKDWYNKMLLIALSSAFGWGVTGMMSYGIVVGYGRSDNFPNAFYGLLMLFVIGGLFGLLGGGLTGLTLESSKEKKVKWASLLAQMLAGGLIVYGFLVKQLEWLMTPPRNETWAICLGASLAMFWYMARNQFRSSLRVAVLTGLGAGFGFAFGNFLQTAGTVLEIRFNMWNVMEYSIGFFGGSALAYSIFTSKWPQTVLPPKPWENIAAFLLLFGLIPLVVFQQSLQSGLLFERFKMFEFVSAGTALFSSIASVLILGTSAVVGWFHIKKAGLSFGRKNVLFLFLLYFAVYIALGYIANGVFAGKTQLNIHLYVVNFIVVLILAKQAEGAFGEHLSITLNSKKASWVLVIVVSAIILMALVSISIHGPMNGAHDRFPLK